METILENWLELKARIAQAAARAGRDPADIEVVAVSKTRLPIEIDAAIKVGFHHLGENRIQETENKKSQVVGSARWHLIGHLQSNKVAKAVALFDMIQSVDSLRLAMALARRAAQSQRHLDLLLQVNTSGASQQGGIAPEEVADCVGEISCLSHVHIKGLMTIAAHSTNEATVRGCFIKLRRLGEDLRGVDRNAEMRCLSMGMSGDFEWAVEEGANMLRLGTAIFGTRPGL
jgi:pyridoxal phosphate enzyme (YggS family)